MKTLHSLTTAALLLAACSAPVVAQNFTMPRFALSGGGGISTDAMFRVVGAIGQPVSGEIADSRFTVRAGFYAPLDSGPAPELLIRLAASNVVLSWPNASTSYVLQQTPNMNGPGGGWTEVTQPPRIVGSQQEVTLPATGRVCLFRLRRQ